MRQKVVFTVYIHSKTLQGWSVESFPRLHNMQCSITLRRLDTFSESKTMWSSVMAMSPVQKWTRICAASYAWYYNPTANSFQPLYWQTSIESIQQSLIFYIDFCQQLSTSTEYFQQPLDSIAHQQPRTWHCMLSIGVNVANGDTYQH